MLIPQHMTIAIGIIMSRDILQILKPPTTDHFSAIVRMSMNKINITMKAGDGYVKQVEIDL